MIIQPGRQSTKEADSLYDEFVTPLMVALWDDNIHVGFWPSETQDVASADPGYASDRLTDLLTDQLGLLPGTRVLDVGCGLGKPACRLARRTRASVVGISINRRQVEMASIRAASEGLADRVSFEYADVRRLPYEDGAFDAILALESVFYFPERQPILRGMARVLRTGGLLVLTDFFNPNRPGADSPLPRFDEYPSIVSDAGLELLELRDITAQTAPTYRTMLDRLVQHEQLFTGQFGQPAVDGIRNILSRCVDADPPNYLLVRARRPMS